MKKIFARKNKDVESAPQQDVVVLINKMQQQLEFLEKKIDTLIRQSSERPSEGKNFSRPFQRFDRPGRYDRGEQRNSFRERSFTKVICADCKQECEVPFKPSSDRPVYCKDCFAKHKNSSGSYDSRPRERGFSQGGNQQEGESRGFSKKKKPGFLRRKERD